MDLKLLELAKKWEAKVVTNDFDLGKRSDITPKQAEDDFNRAQKYLCLLYTSRCV